MLDIRVSSPGDVGKIATIHSVCWRDAYQFMPGEVLENRNEGFRQAQWQKWFDEKRFLQKEALFVLEDEGEVVGFCMCKPNTDPDLPQAGGELHALYILPEHRTFGASFLAAMTLTRFLVENDMAPVCLWAFQKNPIWKWYQRNGFKKMIERNRRINGIDIPEFGLVHFEPEKLIEKTRQQLATAA